ncbi:hypothetical protein ABEB36_004563 [Hypothenemus hampei]|uniref:Uncharacterized protein n=1 Tax=Hypothenemus hampei TaxID=57062 RepID=A0ABD1F3Q8_HYPHA
MMNNSKMQLIINKNMKLCLFLLFSFIINSCFIHFISGRHIHSEDEQNNKIYNPDEFEMMKNNRNEMNNNSTCFKPHQKIDKEESDVDNLTTPANKIVIDDRFLTDAVPCLSGFVKIGHKCLKTSKFHSNSKN